MTDAKLSTKPAATVAVGSDLIYLLQGVADKKCSLTVLGAFLATVVPIWSSGTAAPSGGKNGDFYLRTTTANLYKKSGGTWSIILNMRGIAVGTVDQQCVVIDAAITDREYTLLPYTEVALELSRITVILEAGTTTLDIQLDGVTIPGLGAVVVTDTIQHIDITPITVPVGGKIKAVTSASDVDAIGLEATLKFVRTG